MQTQGGGLSSGRQTVSRMFLVQSPAFPHAVSVHFEAGLFCLGRVLKNVKPVNVPKTRITAKATAKRIMPIIALIILF